MSGSRGCTTASKPVVIADTQANPGGGGPGDTTGLLRAIPVAKAKGAVFGALIDSIARARASCWSSTPRTG
jgi:microcystin degradation protein MlrC